MAEAEAKPESSPAPKTKTRVSAENRYPVFSLSKSIEVASKVQGPGGNVCSPEQLGAFLGYKNTAGGGYVARVAAARQFGLIETHQGRYRVTDRAQRILFPVRDEEKRRALVEAFLAVPVYRKVYEAHRGKTLPTEFGLRNFMKTEFGVPGERTQVAVRVLLESAETAGYFEATGQRDQLVEPRLEAVTETGSERRGEDPPAPLHHQRGNGGGGGGQAPPVHQALVGLLTLIPSAPGPWVGRAAFDSAWRSTMDVLYPPQKGTEGGGDEVT